MCWSNGALPVLETLLRRNFQRYQRCCGLIPRIPGETPIQTARSFLHINYPLTTMVEGLKGS